MPIEALIASLLPERMESCPRCGTEPFESFLRGMVVRWGRKWLVGPRRPPWAVICRECKEIVGWEDIP